MRPEPHEQQQHDAIDQDAVLGRDAEEFGQADQRDRSDDRADDVAEAAQDHDRQRQDGLLRIEGLVVDIGVKMRGDATADAGGETAEDEGER